MLVHRGSSQFAKENTLEAYRATFELGADGNEIDLRQTHDGVLINFHDDLLDFHLAAHGDVSDYTWEELQRFAFRRPGDFAGWTRLPTLVETFDLHRRHAGFLHLDIKDPATAAGTAELLTVLDLWDHVSGSNHPTITGDPRDQPLSVFSLIDEGDDADPGRLAEDPGSPWQNVPLSWLDFRIKGIAWVGLEEHPDTAAVAQLVQDYLALSRSVAYEMGILQ